MKIWLPTDWIRAAYYECIYSLVHEMDWPFGILSILEWAECEGIIPKIIEEFRPGSKLKLAPFPRYDVQEFYHDFWGSYDVVVLDQVLEHVPDFHKAIENCVQYLRPFGYLFIGAPWQYPYHAAPQDYWRISVDGYRLLFEKYGLEEVEISGWGHQEALIYGHQVDAFLSAGFCSDCYEPKRGDPNKPCAYCGNTQWTNGRTVVMAEEAGLFDIESDTDHAIEIWAVGRKR